MKTFALGVVCLVVGAFQAGVTYQKSLSPEANIKDQLFHTDRALKGCELVSSQVLRQVTEAEYRAAECKQAQDAFIDALNSLGDNETSE